MGPLHDPVTWYKIIYTGEQVAQWDFQNNATRTSSPGPAFVLEVPLRNLLTSIYNFVPCDWVVQRAHCFRRSSCILLPSGACIYTLKGPLKYLLMPLLGKNQLAITLHMYASIGPNLDNTHRGQI